MFNVILQVTHSTFIIHHSTVMEYLVLFLKTIAFRPYVFVFLAAFLFAAVRLIGWRRTWLFWLISWGTAFACEYSSTRTGIPFGWYFYNGSTIGQELYISNIPFMDSISFSFLLYAAYCVALCLLLPIEGTTPFITRRLNRVRFDVTARTSMSVLLLTAFLFAFIDMVIDPVALRGDRWFLGKIYFYPDPGVHFGVPFANYVGWAVVGILSLALYFPLERRLPALSLPTSVTPRLLLGVGLYYGVLAFNLGVTFWIGESFMGLSGLLMHLPVLALLLFRLINPQTAPSTSYPKGIHAEER
jgi:putative membrane protein